MRTRFISGISFLVIAVLIIIYPFIVPSYYFTALLTQVLIFVIFTMGLNLAAGYIGLPSLGHGALFGTGAYTAAILMKQVSHNIWVGLFAGISMASFIAAIFALISLGARRVYFIFITMALGQVVWAIAWEWRSLTGGFDGLPGISNPELWPSLPLSGGTSCYYLALFLFVLVLFIMYRIVRSPFGIAMVGIRENESRMRVLGYDVWRYKFITFVISGAFSGLAGVIWAYFNSFVNPRDISFGLSAEALLIVILGGSGTLGGPVIGTIIVVIIKNIVAAYIARWLLVLGVAYILTVLFVPQGIISGMRDWLKKL